MSGKKKRLNSKKLRWDEDIQEPPSSLLPPLFNVPPPTPLTVPLPPITKEIEREIIEIKEDTPVSGGDDKYSPSHVQSDDEPSISQTKPKLLNKEQAKKRLMAFSMAKQQTVSPVKRVNPLKEKLKKEKPPLKSASVIDQLRATVNSIEAEKRREQIFEDAKLGAKMLTIIQSVEPDSTTQDWETRRNSRRSHSRSRSHNRRRRSSSRHSRRRTRSRSDSRRKDRLKKKDLLPKLPNDWKSFKTAGYVPGTEFLKIKMQETLRRKNRSRTPENKWQPIYNYFTNNFPKGITSLQATCEDPREKKLYSYKTVKYTNSRPQLTWSENQDRASEYYLPLKSLVDNCDKAVVPYLAFFTNKGRPPALETTENSPQSISWYPKSEYLMKTTPGDNVKLKLPTHFDFTSMDEESKLEVEEENEGRIRRISLVDNEYGSDGEIAEEEEVEVRVDPSTVKVRSKWDSDYEESEKEMSKEQSPSVLSNNLPVPVAVERAPVVKEKVFTPVVKEKVLAPVVENKAVASPIAVAKSSPIIIKEQKLELDTLVQEEMEISSQDDKEDVSLEDEKEEGKLVNEYEEFLKMVSNDVSIEEENEDKNEELIEKESLSKAKLKVDLEKETDLILNEKLAKLQMKIMKTKNPKKKTVKVKKIGDKIKKKKMNKKKKKYLSSESEEESESESSVDLKRKRKKKRKNTSSSDDSESDEETDEIKKHKKMKIKLKKSKNESEDEKKKRKKKSNKKRQRSESESSLDEEKRVLKKKIKTEKKNKKYKLDKNKKIKKKKSSSDESEEETKLKKRKKKKKKKLILIEDSSESDITPKKLKKKKKKNIIKEVSDEIKKNRKSKEEGKIKKVQKMTKMIESADESDGEVCDETTEKTNIFFKSDVVENPEPVRKQFIQKGSNDWEDNSDEELPKWKQSSNEDKSDWEEEVGGKTEFKQILNLIPINELSQDIPMPCLPNPPARPLILPDLQHIQHISIPPIQIDQESLDDFSLVPHSTFPQHISMSPHIDQLDIPTPPCRLVPNKEVSITSTKNDKSELYSPGNTESDVSEPEPEIKNEPFVLNIPLPDISDILLPGEITPKPKPVPAPVPPPQPVPPPTTLIPQVIPRPTLFLKETPTPMPVPPLPLPLPPLPSKPPIIPPLPIPQPTTNLPLEAAKKPRTPDRSPDPVPELSPPDLNLKPAIISPQKISVRLQQKFQPKIATAFQDESEEEIEMPEKSKQLKLMVEEEKVRKELAQKTAIDKAIEVSELLSKKRSEEIKVRSEDQRPKEENKRDRRDFKDERLKRKRSRSTSPRRKYDRRWSPPPRNRSPRNSPRRRSPPRKRSPSPRRRSPRRRSPVRKRSFTPERKRSPRSRRRTPPRRSRSISPRKYKFSSPRSPSPRRRSPRRSNSPIERAERIPVLQSRIPVVGDDMEIDTSMSPRFIRGVPDSTISDSELNCQPYPQDYVPNRNLVAVKAEEDTDSPKRLTLDQRIELELGVKMSDSPSSSTGTGQYPYPQQPQPYQQFQPHISQYPGYPTSQFYPGSQPYPVVPTTTPCIMRVGNVMEIVPTPPPLPPMPPLPPPPPQQQQTQQIMQVGNMIQVVPSNPPVLTVLPTKKATAVVTPTPATTALPSVHPEVFNINPIFEAMNKEREKIRKEKETRRAEREERRKARESRRLAKMKAKSIHDHDEGRMLGQPVIEEELIDELNVLSPIPSIQIVTESELPIAGKGILIAPGFREKEKTEKKGVKFADGILPGESTSGNEEKPALSPKPQLPKEKRFKKKKVKTKKKVKVHIIRQDIQEEDDEDDDLSPPPPPDGSPPPHLMYNVSYPGTTQVYLTETTTTTLTTTVQFPPQSY